MARSKGRVARKASGTQSSATTAAKKKSSAEMSRSQEDERTLRAVQLEERRQKYAGYPPPRDQQADPVNDDCPDCGRQLNHPHGQKQGVECSVCFVWFHAKCALGHRDSEKWVCQRCLVEEAIRADAGHGGDGESDLFSQLNGTAVQQGGEQGSRRQPNRQRPLLPADDEPADANGERDPDIDAMMQLFAQQQRMLKGYLDKRKRGDVRKDDSGDVSEEDDEQIPPAQRRSNARRNTRHQQPPIANDKTGRKNLPLQNNPLIDLADHAQSFRNDEDQQAEEQRRLEEEAELQ